MGGFGRGKSWEDEKMARRYSRYKRRRGIVILVVLSLLVLFVLLAVTFAIVAGQYQRAAVAYSQQELLGVDGAKDLDKGFYIFLRDTPNPGSVARFHSPLRDIYGEDGFTGALVAGNWLTLFNRIQSPQNNPNNYPKTFDRSGGQCIDLAVNAIGGSTDGNSYTFSQVAGYYNGCVLTFTSGEAKDLSTRIIGSLVWLNSSDPTDPFNNKGILRVVSPVRDDGNSLAPADLSNASFVVNGRPFSGTGFGFNSGATGSGPKLNRRAPYTDRNAEQHNLEIALLPNHAVRDSSILGLLLTGGSDEGYDAPDFQNLAMAIIQTRPGGTVNRMPSFHRPALVQYWRNWTNTTAGITEPSPWQSDVYSNFKRQFILRPIEPNFDGSNPDFYRLPINTSVTPPVVTAGVSWYENGPWDVDNDGDGTRDSIWVDLGLPVQTAPDGRKYKPLFAIMCRDLDGLLNLNAHGRIPVYSRTTDPLYPFHPSEHSNDGGNPQCRLYRHGLGYGPPEIDLLWTGIAGNPAIAANRAKVISLMSGRYGPNGVPGNAGLDPLARIRFFEEPLNYFLGTVGRTSYSSPSDLRAELAFGVTLLGQPIFEPLPPAHPESRAESAYEMNLLDGSVGDAPYTPAEYERLARRFDYDRYLLPNRLAGITKPDRVTTDSFDVPMPSISAPPELVNYINQRSFLSAHNIIDLLVARMQVEWENLGNTNRIPDATVNTQLARMLSVDLAMGRRFDLNRPIGNAQDGSAYDNNLPGDAVHQGVGIVDEAGSVLTNNSELRNEQLYTGNNAIGRAEFNNVSMWHCNGFLEYKHDTDNNGFVDDLDGDGNGNAAPPGGYDADDERLSAAMVARQRYARHLYVLMMTLIDRNFAVSEDIDGDGNINTDDTTHMIAQWAINVVDFRDADSIMTPFEFDLNPFDGWNVDGVLNGYQGMISNDDGFTQRRLVWGCERPELLLTEATGFHARRTRDATTDTAGPTHALGTPAPNNDDDYDQEHLPFASAFIEMYNPWVGIDTNRTPPASIYDNTGVRLHRTTPSGNPVWRLLVINRQDVAGVVNNTFDPDINSGAIDADRAVYFVSQTAIDNGQAVLPAVGGANGHRQYYTDLNVPPIIRPGQHAVIGGGYQNGVEWVSPVGDVDPNVADPALVQPQRIVLNPNTSQVRVYPGTVDPTTGQPTPPTVAQALVIVPNRSTIDVTNTQVRTAFSVSEPRDGYPISVAGGAAIFNESNNPATHVPYSYTGVYEAFGQGTSLPYDEPLDKEDTQFETEVARRDGTNRTFCRVYLQRLANPLLDHTPANPYRTIDSIPMDLTVFNGREAFPSGANDPDVADPNMAVEFSCIQRGDADPSTNRLRLWPQEPAWGTTGANQPTQPTDANSFMYFNYALQNPPLHHNTPAPAFHPWPGHSLGFRNRSYMAAPGYQTPPTNLAFPWLAWNNRPFVSARELMHVPRSSSWQLLKTNNFSLPSGNSPYDGTTPQYGHLLNFFHTSPAIGAAPHFYRIFDYVNVPSRFVGTDTVLNPNYFGKTTNFPQPNFATLGFLPPFNRVSKYRVPGLVNINTVPHWDVWDAIRGPHVTVTYNSSGTPPNDWINPQADYTKTGPGYGVIFNSREASGGSPNIPTWFANPYRPMGAGDLVPLASLQPSEDVDVTIMRGSPGTPQMEIAPATDPDLPRHTRNSFFRYELLHRLGNMVTTRSNVYATWMTVGYFEMEPNIDPTSGQVVFDDLHPEGLRVAQEIGIDTGEIQRHRAFYMIDRTIPVAFEPGQNHNVDKCVLVRRFIE